MDFVQDTITTLHDLGLARPDRTPEGWTAIVPMSGRELEDPTAEGVLEAIAANRPERIIVPIRAAPARAARMHRWLEALGPSTEVLWCNGRAVDELLAEHDLTLAGKGGDVWLAMGAAIESGGVVACFDADVASATPEGVARLVGAVEGDIGFAKAYYARVDDGRFYGRLFRLLYRPLLACLDRRVDHPLLAYLGAFRYALAGEFAADAAAVEGWAFPTAMGLEVATLGEAFATVGPGGSAQVDLGIHRHEHRSVEGRDGLEGIADEVAGALYAVLDRHAGAEVDPAGIAHQYEAAATSLVERYRRDARHNGLAYDPDHERRQIRLYRRAVAEPAEPRWLPPWSSIPLDPGTVREASRRSLRLEASAD